MRPRPVVGEAAVPDAVRRLQDKFDYPDREAPTQVVPILPSLGASGAAPSVNFVTPPNFGWTWVNQGAATETELDTGALLFSAPAVAANNLALRVRPYTAPWTATAMIQGSAIGGGNGGPGLVLRESSTGKFTVAYRKLTGTQQLLVLENWTNATTFSGGAGTGAVVESEGFWLQVEDDNVNVIWRISATGHGGTFIDFQSNSRTIFMAGGPDQIGWAVRDNSSIWRVILWSWLEE